MQLPDQPSGALRDLLLELSLLLGERQGVDEVFAAFARHVRQGAEFDFTSLFVVTADERYIRAVGHYPDLYPQMAPGTIFRSDLTGANDLVSLTDGGEFIPRHVQLQTTQTMAENGFERGWVTGLVVDGKNFGMLTVAKLSRGPFPPEHLEFLRAAARILARAVERDLQIEAARLNEARASAASELIFALQANEPFSSIFERLPTLLAGALDVQYLGLVVDHGDGFVIGAEAPAGVHRNAAPSAEGTAYIHQLAQDRSFLQFKPGADRWAENLMGAGFSRGALSFLREGGELLGVLMVARENPRRFDRDEQQFIALLNSILTQSLVNQGRLARAEVAGARARILNEIALLVNAGQLVDAVFTRLMGLLHQALPLDYIGLLRTTGRPGELEMVGSRPEVVRAAGEVVSWDEVAFGEVLKLGSVVSQYRIENHQDLTDFSRTMRAMGMGRSAVVVLKEGDEIQGLLSVARKTARRFGPDEEDFLETLGAMLAQSIANTRRLSIARTEAARQALVNDLAILLSTGEEPEVFFPGLARQFRAAVPLASLALLVPGRHEGMFRVVQSLRGRTLTAGREFSLQEFNEHTRGRVLAGETIVDGPPSTLGEPLGSSAEGSGVAYGAIAPIRHEGEIVGFFALARLELLPLSPEEREFIQLVSALVGQAIVNLRKVREKEAEAVRSRVLSELAILLQQGQNLRGQFQRLSSILLEADGVDFVSVSTLAPANGEYFHNVSRELTLDGEPFRLTGEAIEPLIRASEHVVQVALAEREEPFARALREADLLRLATAPFSSGDEVVGLLAIGRADEREFSSDEVAFIELLAAMLGQAMANIQDRQAREAEALRSRVLSELGLLLNNGEPLEAHFERLRELLLQGVGFDFCSVAVRVRNESVLKSFRSELLPGDAEDSGPLPLTALTNLVAMGTTSVQYGEEAIRKGARGGMFKLGIQRAASFVLTTGDEQEGLLTIGRRAGRPFTDTEMKFLEVVASLLAHAAANERRLSMTTAEAEDQAILADAASAVARESEAVGIVRSLRASVGRFIPSPFVSFGYLSEEAVEFPAADGSRVALPRGRAFGIALAEGQCVVTPEGDFGTPESEVEVDRVGVHAHVVSRASSRGVANGLLVVGSRDPGWRPSVREQRLCALFANIVGPAMANARIALREREAAEDEQIVAEAAAALARENDPYSIAVSLKQPLSRFVPDVFVRFADWDGERLAFRGPNGAVDRQPLGRYFRAALESGQSVVPGVAVREAAGEVTARSRKARLESHVLTRADSAGTVIGFLLVGSRSESFAPGPRQLALCRRIADIVGPAMANARAAERERAEAEEQALIAAASSAVASETNALGIVIALREAVSKFVPAAFVNFGFTEGDACLYPTREGPLKRIPYGPRFKEALANGQSVVPNDSGRTIEWTAEPRRVGLEAHICTRAMSAGTVVGLLVVGSRDADWAPGDRELRLCRLIADIVAPAMANWRALERERAEAEDQAIIGEAAAAVARESTPLQIVRGLRTAVARFIPSPFVNFGALEDDSVRFPTRDGEFSELPVAYYFGRALEEGQVVVPSTSSRVAAGEQHLEGMVRIGIEAHVLTRASTAGTTTGLLLVGSRDASFEPGERELRLCRLLADIVGPAMANARLALREREEAENQRVLADVAAVGAREDSPTSILRSIQAPFEPLIPRPVVVFAFRDSDDLLFPRSDGSFTRAPVGSYAPLVEDEGQISATELPPDLAATDLGTLGIRAISATTARSAGTIVGFLLVGSRSPKFRFNKRTLGLCRQAAQVIGPAMENARAAEQARLDAEEQSILAEAAAAIAAGTSEAEIAGSLPGPVRRIVPGSVVNAFFVEGDMAFAGGALAGRFGPQLQKAMDVGQIVIQKPWPEMSEIGAKLLSDGGFERFVLTALSAGGESRGVLFVGVQDDTRISARSLRLLRLIGDMAGPAFANARESARRQQEAEEQRFLAAVASEAARAEDEPRLLKGVASAIRRTVEQVKVDLFCLEPDGIRSTGLNVLLPVGAQWQRALAHGEYVGTVDDPEITDEGRLLQQEAGIVRSASFRLASGGRPLGIFWIGTSAPLREFSANELRLYRLVADIIGPALGNIRESRRRHEEAEEQRFLADIASAAASATDEVMLVRGLFEPFHRLLPQPRVGCFMVEDGGVRVVGGPDQVFEFGPQSRRTLETGQVAGSIADEEITATSRTYANILGIRSWVDTALTPGALSLGYLFVGTRDAVYAFSERDKRLFRLVADIVGPALANIRESRRRQDDAEEQRILAAAATSVATSASETALIDGLQAHIRALVPEGRLLFYYAEGEHFRDPFSGALIERGPQTIAALELGQFEGDLSSTDISASNRAYLEREGVTRWVYTAVSSGGELLGVVLIATASTEYRFGPADFRRFRLIADIVGPALANLRESRRRQEDAEEQRILAEAAAALAAGISETDILQRLVGPVRRFVPRARVAFSYIEGDEVMLWDGRNRRPIHELSRRAIETGQIEASVDAPMTEASRDLIASVGVRSYIDTAATSGGTPVGLLFVGTPEPDFRFSDRDRRMLRLVADMTGPAMVNARDDRRRREEADDDRIISDIAAIAARAGRASEIVEAIPQALAGLVPEAFTLWGFIENDHLVYDISRPADQQVIGGDTLSLPLSPVGRSAIASGQAVGTLANTPSSRSWAAFELHAYALTAYVSAGAPVGMLLVSSRDEDYGFDDRTLALLGRIVRVVGPAIDALRAEAALARQTELYSLMLRSLSEGVILSDIDGRVMFANALGRTILRALDPTGEASGWEQIVHLLPEEVRDGYRDVYQRGLGSRGRANLAVDGRPVWYDYEFVPLNDPVMKVLIVAADVTADVEREAEQARHREQLEQASRLAALGELVGGVAHELNNPLTAILGFAEVMALSPAAEPLTEDLAIIQKEALRARNIVRDLLFIVRPGTTERSLISVTELVGHIERLRRTAWTQQGIEARVRIDEGCQVWGNEHQLIQVFLNLVTNAEHAMTDRPERRLLIEAHCEGRKTLISVSDTGAGMDEGTRNRVFEPFFTTKQGHGTGLGLPLSYSIVQSHEGEIRIESEPGKGTTFTVVLPAMADSGEAEPPAPAPEEPERLRVLVIDDEPSLRKVCQRLIASMGHYCETAESSAEALDAVARSDFDMILCDYRLATETADQVVAGLEQTAPHLIPRMVIATGATTDAGVVELTEKHGIRLMAKPYGVDELSSVIRQVGAAPAA